MSTLYVNKIKPKSGSTVMVTGSLEVSGTIKAYEFNTITVSQTDYLGSTSFGNDSDDVHQFTGSIELTGSGITLVGAEAGAATLTLKADQGDDAADAATLSVADGGNVTIDAAGDIILDADGADVVLKDGGTTKATFSMGASLTIDCPSGDLTLDSAGDIVLDAGGADVIYKDDGTQYGVIQQSSNAMFISASLDDLKLISGKDILLDAGSYVGIGTTSPAYDLDVSGSGRFTGNLIVSGTLDAHVEDFKVTANAMTFGDASGDTLTINAATAATPNGLNFDSNTLVIDASNNRVGIGASSPSSTLEIEGSSGDLILEMDNNVANSANFQIQNGAGNNRVDLVMQDSTGTNTTFTMKGQKVGVGDTSPSYTLDVAGNAQITTDLRVGDDLLLTSDSAILSLGDGADATLTHDGTTGLTIAATPITINSTGDLTLDSDTDIILDASADSILIKDNGTQYAKFSSDSGLQFTGSLFLSGSGITVTAAEAGTATLTLKADQGDDAADTGAISVADGGNLTIDSAADIILDADGADVSLKDGGTQYLKFTNSSGDAVVYNGAADGDIKFTDAGGNEVFRMDGGEESLLLASSKKLMLGATQEYLYGDGTDIHVGVGSGGDINIPADIGLTFGDDGEKIEGDGSDLTIAASGQLNINTDTAVFSSANSTDPLVTIKNTTNDANGARLRFVKDKGAAGAANDVAGVIEFYADDASQDQVLFSEIKSQVKVHTNGQEGGKFTISVAENDGTSTAGLIIQDGDADGELDVTIGAGGQSVVTVPGDIDVDGVTNLDNTDIDGTLVVDGSNISLDSTSTLNIDNSNTSNGITIGTATSGVPISIGHSTSETTVNDNLTVTGDLTVQGATTTVNSTTIAVTSSFTFEGTVPDAHETVLGVVNPTADATINLPAMSAGTYYLPVLSAASTTAVSSTPAELNLLDGCSAGTVVNSKAVIYSADGDINVGDNLTFSSDGAVCSFGVNGEVTLTHVHDTGLLLSDDSGVGTTKLMFGDSACFIQQQADGELGVDADSVINVTAPTVDIDASTAVTIDTDTITMASANSQDPLVVIKNTTNDANGARLRFVKDKGAAGADDDVIGLIEFYGDDDNQDQVLFGKITGYVSDASNGAEGGKISVGVATHDGEFKPGLIVEDGSAEDEVDVTLGFGAASVTLTSGLLTTTGEAKVGTAAGSGVDAYLYTAGTAAHVGIQWDADGNTEGTLIGGADDHGVDFKFFGETSGKYVQWDMSGDELVLASSSKLSFHDAGGDENIVASADGHLEVNAGTTLDMTAPTVDINASTAVTIDTDTATFGSANSTDPLVVIKNTTNDANGARLRFVKDKGAAGADNDVAGLIEFYADDDNQDNILFAKVEAAVADASNSAEGGKLTLSVATHDGEIQPGLIITDGSAEDEVDVTIGNGADSLTTIAGDLDIPNGGFALGSDASGDMYYRNSSGVLTRIAVGSDNHVLTLDGAVPGWEAASGGGGAVSAVANGSDNRIVTFSSSDALNGEANLTFDGTDLAATLDTATFTSANSTDPLIVIKNTTNDANGARLRFVKDKGAAGAANDVAGLIEFYADDANQDQVLFAKMEAAVAVHTNGQEGGKLSLGVATHDGEFQNGLILTDGDAEDEIDVTIGNGTASLTTIAGTSLFTGNATFGADDTGVDVRFFSATASEGVLYDASEDELGLLLTTKLKFHDIGGGEEIFASSNGHLEINSGTTLDMTAPTVDVNAATAVTIDSPSVVISSSTDDKPEVEIKSTHSGSNPPTLLFNHDSANPADDDELGEVVFNGDDDGGTSTMYAKIVGVSEDVTNGTEDGSILFKVRKNGGVSEMLSLNVDGGGRVIVGDGTAEDTMILFDGNAQDYRIGIDDGTDKLEIGHGNAHGTRAAIVIDSSGDVTQIGTDTPSDTQVLTWDNSNSKVVWSDAGGGATTKGITILASGNTPLTLTTSHGVILVDTSAGAYQVTLPSSDLADGQIFHIKDQDGNASTNNITIALADTTNDRIDGSTANVVINQDYGSVTLTQYEVSSGVYQYFIL